YYVACVCLEFAHENHVGDNDLRQQTPRMRSDKVSVKVDQHITTLHRVACLYSWREALPFEHYRVETDVHKHFDTFRCCDRHCMARRVNLGDSSITGRDETLAHRIERNSTSHHLLGEHRIGNSLDRQQMTGQWRDQLDSPARSVERFRYLFSCRYLRGRHLRNLSS